MPASAAVSSPDLAVPEPPARTLPDALRRDFADALAPRIEGDLRADAMTRALYATDASMYRFRPAAVLFPRAAADVQAALEACQHFGIPLVPRGGGSSLAGQAVGTGLVVDFSRYMDEIIDIDPEARVARVQPGVVLDDLNRAAAAHGLTVGPDPSSGSRATLGGMTATNATGTHSILYGNMVHHVRRVKGFLADGTPVTFGPLSEKEWSAAYRRDGAEGALYREIGALLSEGKEIIARDTSRHWRRNSGYRLEHLLSEEDFAENRPGIDGDPHFQRRPGEERSLARLVCGSEGTLMTMTEIEIGLVERPERTVLGLAHFETRQAALRAVEDVLETGPSAVELFDGVVLERCRLAPGFAEKLTFIEEAPGGGDPGGLLIAEYSSTPGNEHSDERSDDLDEKLHALEEVIEQSPGYAVVRRTTPDQIADVWTVRKEGLGLLMGVKGRKKPWAFIEDASVPVPRLPDYIDALSDLIEETDTRAVYYAHASGGCLHVRPFVDTRDPDEIEKIRRIARGSMEAVRARGGTVSSEHGDGRVRGWLNEELLGNDLYQLNRRLKDIFDPEGLLNPGVIVEAPPIAPEDLRMGPHYRTRSFATELDFSADGGLAGAIELCNGNGACRKTHGGTMCPSYRATREEEHSTRGRANALRMALSGALTDDDGTDHDDALTSERMKDVMDLCIQCKACKTECPSNVDLGKLKKEWMAHVIEEEGLPLRDRLFSGLPSVSRRVAGTFLARPLNAAAALPLSRWGLSFAGVSSERKLPPFARQTFRQWFEKSEFAADGAALSEEPERRSLDGPEPAAPPRRVAIFIDTFTNYHTPEVGRAAVRVLHALGMQPVLPEQKGLCCGRTLLSKGRVSEAQRRALDVVEALLPFARRGIPVVGLEPSCTSALSDDLRSLLPGDPHAEAVADAVVSFEELLHRRAAGGDLPTDGVWAKTERHVLLHGHCHQKALEGIAPAQKALALPPGHHVETVDSGCCGMAGAFGYETEHVEVSKTMAELELAPAVRAAPEDTTVTAPGFSCRSQITDVTGREALHPAEVLADALA